MVNSKNSAYFRWKRNSKVVAIAVATKKLWVTSCKRDVTKLVRNLNSRGPPIIAMMSAALT